MNSNFAFNNGMTIQIPPFNAASDQLFLTIKNYFDSRFTELEDKINEILTTNTEISDNLATIKRDIREMKCSSLKKGDTGHNHFQRRKIFRQMKRKISVSTCAAEPMNAFENCNEIKKECEHRTEITVPEINGTNSFLSAFSNGSIYNAATNNYTADNNITTETQPTLSKNKGDTIMRDESLEPIVIHNPADNREIFIGGNDSVRLSLWAYKKCLTCIRGKPNELNSRLCLRLLQAKFGRQYMLSHNYNGSGDKLPIDRVIMQAILSQVKMQFPNQDDMQNNPARFAMFRDYINNAFRVVAYRHRKGIQSNTPFWDQNGEPIKDLDPPTWVVEHIK